MRGPVNVQLAFVGAYIKCTKLCHAKVFLCLAVESQRMPRQIYVKRYTVIGIWELAWHNGVLRIANCEYSHLF